MMTVMLDGEEPDDYWNGMTVDEFMVYLDSLPEYQPGEPVEDLDGKPWPTSIEAQRWDYDAPGMREYEAEDDMEDNND